MICYCCTKYIFFRINSFVFWGSLCGTNTLPMQTSSLLSVLFCFAVSITATGVSKSSWQANLRRMQEKEILVINQANKEKSLVSLNEKNSVGRVQSHLKFSKL